MQALENALVPCSYVDWFHLTRIRPLSIPIHFDPDLAWYALLGLTNLTRLQLRLWLGIRVTIPAELLVHTPRLKRLDVAVYSHCLWIYCCTPLIWKPCIWRAGIRQWDWFNCWPMHPIWPA